MFVGVFFKVLLFLFLIYLIGHIYNELWDHHVAGRRAHVIVHGVFLVLVVGVLVVFVGRIIMRLI
jgi:hypothetical protein